VRGSGIIGLGSNMGEVGRRSMPERATPAILGLILGLASLVNALWSRGGVMYPLPMQ